MTKNPSSGTLKTTSKLEKLLRGPVNRDTEGRVRMGIGAGRGKYGFSYHRAVMRYGELILLAFYISLLAGRFSLTRLSDSSSTADFSLDLRWILLSSTILLVLTWYISVSRVRLVRRPMVGIIPYGLWCFWLLLSASWAPAGAETANAVLDVVFLFAFLFLTWFVVAHLDPRSLEKVWMWVLVTGLIYFVLALAAGPDVQGRYAAPGGGPNTFVRIMVISAIAALYLTVVRSKRWPLLCFPIFIVGAILSGSRGGLLSAAIVFVFFLIPLIRILRVRHLIGLGAVVGLAAYITYRWRDGYVYTLIHERYIQQTLVDGYASGRDTIAEQAWSMFRDSPIVGVGLNAFDFLESGSADYGYAHNLLLSTLAEAGIIGGVLLLVALGRLVYAAIRRVPNPSALFAFAAGIFFLATSMFSGDYYDSRFVWFFLALAAIPPSAAGSSLRPRLTRSNQGATRQNAVDRKPDITNPTYRR